MPSNLRAPAIASFFGSSCFGSSFFAVTSLVALPFLATAGCSSDAVSSEPDTGNADSAIDTSGTQETPDGALPLGPPITAPTGAWTWVDFPDSACDDGTPTGIGVYPSAKSDKLFVFFNGGGACWDYLTCVQLNTSTHGPFGAAQFAAAMGGGAGSVLDPNASQNPFKDYSLVFVPYCTGDIHGGDAVRTYTFGANTRTIHHKGHANVLAYLARLAATWKTPGQIAVTGSSAGGGGALFNYASFRAWWPATPTILVDDSLPLFEGTAISTTLRTAWFESWNLAPLVDSICGVGGCRNDMSLIMKAIAQKYASDRMALLSSTRDKTIRSYFLLSAADFEKNLTALTTDVLDPLPNFKHFYVAAESHTMLGSPGSFTAGGRPLWTWLTQMATADSAWSSAGP